jgi:hypothetical protein
MEVGCYSDLYLNRWHLLHADPEIRSHLVRSRRQLSQDKIFRLLGAIEGVFLLLMQNWH